MNWIVQEVADQAIPLLREKAAGRPMSTYKVLHWINRMLNGEDLTFANVIGWLPVAERLQDRLASHGFTCDNGMWTFAKAD